MADEETKTEETTDAPVEEVAPEAPAVADAPATDAPADDAGEDLPAGEAGVEVPEKFKALVDQVEAMSVLELHELVKLLEKKFGVSAQAVAVAGPAAAEGDDDGGSSTVNIELTEAGGQKIAVIKAVKEILGLGLKEAKDLVDGAPNMLKEGVAKEEAEEIKTKLEEAGGKVSFK